MAHTLKFSIELEDKYCDNDGGQDTVKKLCEGLIEKTPRRFSFEELNKMLFLEGRQYYVTGVEFCDYDLSNQDIITKIDIKG